MQVLINQSPVDVTFTNETNAGAALASLSHWLDEQGWALTGASVDGAEFSAPLAERPLSGVSQLAVEALPLTRLEQLRLGTWRQAALGVLQGWTDGTLPRSDLAKARAELLEPRDGLPVTLLHQLDSEADALWRRLREHWPAQEAPSAEQSPGLQQDLLALIDRMARLEAWTADPAVPAADLLARRDALVPDLGRLAVLWSTRQDGSAWTLVENLARWLGDVLSLLRLTQALVPAARTAWAEALGSMKELQPLLEELLSALERQDTVLAGDLAEYELGPRLSGLQFPELT